jgi:hypothetical protein
MQPCSLTLCAANCGASASARWRCTFLCRLLGVTDRALATPWLKPTRMRTRADRFQASERILLNIEQKIEFAQQSAVQQQANKEKACR